MRREIVILGGAGIGSIVAQAIADLAATGEKVRALGFLNDVVAAGTLLEGCPCSVPSWHGRVAWRVRCSSARYRSRKEAWPRHLRLRGLGIPADRWTTIRHPAARVADGAAVGQGSYLGPNTVVAPGASIGSHACLRGGCYVSHDVRIGDFAFVGPNASLMADSSLGEGAHFAANRNRRRTSPAVRHRAEGRRFAAKIATDQLANSL